MTQLNDNILHVRADRIGMSFSKCPFFNCSLCSVHGTCRYSKYNDCEYFQIYLKEKEDVKASS